MILGEDPVSKSNYENRDLRRGGGWRSQLESDPDDKELSRAFRGEMPLRRASALSGRRQQQELRLEPNGASFTVGPNIQYVGPPTTSPRQIRGMDHVVVNSGCEQQDEDKGCHSAASISMHESENTKDSSESWQSSPEETDRLVLRRHRPVGKYMGVPQVHQPQHQKYSLEQNAILTAPVSVFNTHMMPLSESQYGLHYCGPPAAGYLGTNPYEATWRQRDAGPGEYLNQAGGTPDVPFVSPLRSRRSPRRCFGAIYASRARPLVDPYNRGASHQHNSSQHPVNTTMWGQLASTSHGPPGLINVPDREQNPRLQANPPSNAVAMGLAAGMQTPFSHQQGVYIPFPEPYAYNQLVEWPPPPSDHAAHGPPPPQESAGRHIYSNRAPSVSDVSSSGSQKSQMNRAQLRSQLDNMSNEMASVDRQDRQHVTQGRSVQRGLSASEAMVSSVGIGPDNSDRDGGTYQGSHGPKLMRTTEIRAYIANNPLQAGLRPQQATLKINGDLEAVSKDWKFQETMQGRRLVRFYRHQQGAEITLNFDVIQMEEYQNDMKVISCIWWQSRRSYYVTSVDCILLLEYIVDSHFKVEERNRTRRNLEVCKPMTIAKVREETAGFFRQIMRFDPPRPRHIEKDVKVLPWSKLEIALQKIISKYSALVKADDLADESASDLHKNRV